MPTHPAKFSDEVLDAALAFLWSNAWTIPDDCLMLDPFAGTGKGSVVADKLGMGWLGVEIEPEWAEMEPRTLVGDSRNLVKLLERKHMLGLIGAVFTSPVYGNRMSDHHDAKDTSRRITYRHSLGRALNHHNAGRLHFKKRAREYEKLHFRVWKQCYEALNPGGLMMVNVKNFIRGGDEMDVVGFHEWAMRQADFTMFDKIKVDTPGMRFGENNELRVDGEVILVGVKPRG